MAERKWGAIDSGATFEALATTIVFFEDPTAVLFGRRGKDGGQDVRSGDGALVYQAKHHVDGSAARTIADAKKEAAKISAYRQLGHPRHDQWTGVKHWRLVTNAVFNPTDQLTWDTEVAPLLAAQGLTAELWGRAHLEALLDKHPEIHRSFFENETRAFLSVPEVRERLPAQEPFLQRAELGGFVGRDAELAEVDTFLTTTSLFLVVHGAGGMGKTRLLVEAGESIASKGTWQVLWANVASMAATGAWFEAIVPERPTLLLVDEPPDEVLLQQLAEQLGGRVGRTAQWKVAVAVRSPKDPVLRFLFGPRMKPRVRELAIGALQESTAEAMCGDLLRTGALSGLRVEKRDHAARELSRRFSRHPVWLTLAVHVLEKRGDLSDVPATAKDLADSYLDEVFRSQRDSLPEQVRDLLRWVALIGTVNRAEDATIELIGDESGAGDVVQVRGKLAALVDRRALVEWGARNRFVEIKPDVLRDHILLTWLSVDVGFGDHRVVPSDDAKELVAKVRDAVIAGHLSGPGRAILLSLARTQFLLKLSSHDVPLLNQFFEDVRAAIGTMTASRRLALVELLETVAAFQPVAATRMVEALRLYAAPDETIRTIFDARTVGQDEILLSLAWPLFHAAMGAQTLEAQEAVLVELCELADVESDLALRLRRGLPNDGKRAATLVTRVLAGGPQFWGDFDTAARTLGEALLNDVSRQPPTSGKRTLLKALVQPAVSIERQQTWSDERAFHMQTFAIGPDHPAWTTREVLLARIKDALSTGTTPAASRIALWHVLAEAHRSINRVCKRGEPKHQPFFDALLGDLVWARKALEGRAGDGEELSAARELWDWHHQFEKDPRLKEAADALEAVYLANDLAGEFEPLLARADWKQREPRAAAKAAELADADTAGDIFAFIDRAARFLGGDHELHQVSFVAWALGAHAASREAVRTFVTSCLGRPEVSARTDFGTVTAATWVASVRTGSTSQQTHVLVRELMGGCGSDHQRVHLALQLYGRGGGDLTPGEHALLRSLKPLFQQQGQAPAFVSATARTLGYEWPALKALLEDVLQSVPPGERAASLRALIQAVNSAVHGAVPASLPAGLSTWLLDQLLPLPDFDDLGGNVEWYLEDTLKLIGRVPLTWLPAALAARSALEGKHHGGARFHALGYHARLSTYVKSVTAADLGDQAILRCGRYAAGPRRRQRLRWVPPSRGSAGR